MNGWQKIKMYVLDYMWAGMWLTSQTSKAYVEFSKRGITINFAE